MTLWLLGGEGAILPSMVCSGTHVHPYVDPLNFTPTLLILSPSSSQSLKSKGLREEHWEIQEEIQKIGFCDACVKGT